MTFSPSSEPRKHDFFQLETVYIFWTSFQVRYCMWVSFCLEKMRSDQHVLSSACLLPDPTWSEIQFHWISDPAPFFRDPAPLFRDPAPLLSDPAPLLSDLAPLLSDPAPLLSDLAPLLPDPAPLLSDPAPILWEPTPHFSDACIWHISTNSRSAMNSSSNDLGLTGRTGAQPLGSVLSVCVAHYRFISRYIHIYPRFNYTDHRSRNLLQYHAGRPSITRSSPAPSTIHRFLHSRLGHVTYSTCPCANPSLVNLEAVLKLPSVLNAAVTYALMSLWHPLPHLLHVVSQTETVYIVIHLGLYHWMQIPTPFWARVKLL